jgi:hypothetical protein
MKRDELSKHLNEYAKKVTTGAADTSHFNDIKNKIRQAYDAGNLDKETMSELGKKASFNFKNMGKTPILQDLVPKILEKGGTVGKFEEAAEPMLGKVVKKAGKGLKSFGPLLGMLGAGAAAAGIGNKAMAGDLDNDIFIFIFEFFEGENATILTIPRVLSISYLNLSSLVDPKFQTRPFLRKYNIKFNGLIGPIENFPATNPNDALLKGAIACDHTHPSGKKFP